MMKKRIEALKNEIKSETSQGKDVPVLDKTDCQSSAGSKCSDAESRISPVSVATQTSFNPGEGKPSASSLEKINGDASEKINGTLGDEPRDNGLETECNDDDDENEEIDVENDDPEIGTESKETIAEKDELAATNEESEIFSRGKPNDRDVDTKLHNKKAPNGVIAFEAGKESNRKRPYSERESEEEREERNAKIKGCARVSC